MQQLHLKYTFIVRLTLLPAWVAYALIYYSSYRQCKCQRSLSGACQKALTFRLQQAETLKFAWKVVRHPSDRHNVWLLRLHHQPYALCRHRTKMSHFWLSKQDSAGSTEHTLVVKETYSFGASYQEQMSPPGDLQIPSSRHLKKHLQLGKGMRWITISLLLRSAGAILISMHGLQELLPQSLLSLWLPIAYVYLFASDSNSGFVCTLRIQNTGCIHSGRDDITPPCPTLHLTLSLTVWSQTSKLKPPHPSAKHSQHHISALDNVWKQHVTILQALYCSAYRLAWTASPLNLALEPSQILHQLFWNRNWHSDTAVPPVIKLCRPPTVGSPFLHCTGC